MNYLGSKFCYVSFCSINFSEAGSTNNTKLKQLSSKRMFRGLTLRIECSLGIPELINKKGMF